DAVLIEEAFAEAKLLNVVNRAADGEEALDYLWRRGKYESVTLPGLVLLDINMPKKNGFEVLHEMKSDPLLKHVPVVMLTTSSRDEDIVKSYGKGVCSFITKPVSFSEFNELASRFSLYWALVAKIPRLHTNV
ncbi:MAG: response regulator, partial [Thermoguttaceae bacterium]